MFAIRLVTLVSGAQFLVRGASKLAVSVRSAWGGQVDIALGNVVGSNTFNILGVLGVLGVSSLVAPAELQVAHTMLSFDRLVMVAVALACLPIFFTGHKISRWEGALFLCYFVVYTAVLLLAAQQHDALETYGTVMLTVVLPLTALTLAVIAARYWRARQR